MERSSFIESLHHSLPPEETRMRKSNFFFFFFLLLMIFPEFIMIWKSSRHFLFHFSNFMKDRRLLSLNCSCSGGASCRQCLYLGIGLNCSSAVGERRKRITNHCSFMLKPDRLINVKGKVRSDMRRQAEENSFLCSVLFFLLMASMKATKNVSPARWSITIWQ